MHKRMWLSLWAAILLWAPTVQGTTEIEEIVVTGIDLSERALFQVALSSVVLVHEYNKEKDQWEFVKAVDTSKEKEEKTE